MNTDQQNKHFSLIDKSFYMLEDQGLYEQAGTWPSDLVEVDADTEALLREAIRVGKTIESTADGWSFTEPPIDVDKLVASIQRIRDQKYLGGVQVNGYWFHSDADSRTSYMELKDSARDIMDAGGGHMEPIMELDQPIQWKTMSGQTVPMTVDLAFKVVAAVKQHRASVFATANTHVTGVTNGDPVDYDIQSMWPLTYADTL